MFDSFLMSKNNEEDNEEVEHIVQHFFRFTAFNVFISKALRNLSEKEG